MDPMEFDISALPADGDNEKAALQIGADVTHFFRQKCRHWPGNTAEHMAETEEKTYCPVACCSDLFLRDDFFVAASISSTRSLRPTLMSASMTITTRF